MHASEAQVYAAILIGISFIIVIIRYFIVSALKQQKKVLELYRQSANAEITALEKDRSRIAADLHDDLAPKLSALKMKINSFDLQQSDDEHQLSSCNNIIDELSTKLREISFDLMPATLPEKGVLIAIQEFIGNINKGSCLKVRLNVAVPDLHFGDEKSVHFYRIVQELVQNTLKHAGASLLLIDIRQEKNKVVLVTSDNGVGFDHNEAIADKIGIGLGSLMNRVALLGAELNLETCKGKGTVYKIEIPL
jgi:two-component system, NarL family, sensor kinase